MPLELIRGLYAYHWWANRRLADVAAALGDGVEREIGTQFSFPTLKGMFAHVYGADAAWLARWGGESPARLATASDFPTFAALRTGWDDLEKDQRAFVEALTPADLTRVIHYRNTEGKPFSLPLWPLLQHVVNHATHHRSEVATMLTMVTGSPPPTNLVDYHLITSGQVRA
jgi:uncharacterized damage-inducible protein DinB